jgi:hypothetical protein
MYFPGGKQSMGVQVEAHEAARALAAASSAVERGARSVRPAHPWRYVLVTCVAALAVGASFDIPASLWGVGAVVRFPIPMVVVLIWTVYTRRVWRARPIERGWTRRFLAGVIAVHLVFFAGAALAGLALRDSGVPLPFTVASLCYVMGFVGLAVLLAPRLSAGYARSVVDDGW